MSVPPPMMEWNKLEFGPRKCFKMHIGSSKSDCQDLRVESTIMNTSEFETYLGDVICVSGTNKSNIEIYILRDSMLVSKLVSSSEIWYNVSKEQLRKLEEVDEMYYMRLFQAPKSVPRLSLYKVQSCQ